jgi:hypothetical protein
LSISVLLEYQPFGIFSRTGQVCSDAVRGNRVNLRYLFVRHTQKIFKIQEVFRFFRKLQDRFRKQLKLIFLDQPVVDVRLRAGAVVRQVRLRGVDVFFDDVFMFYVIDGDAFGGIFNIRGQLPPA